MDNSQHFVVEVALAVRRVHDLCLRNFRASFEEQLRSFRAGEEIVHRANSHLEFVLVRFPSFGFHHEFTAARGTSGTTGAFTREHLFVVRLSKDAMKACAYSTQSSRASFPNKNVQEKRPRFVLFSLVAERDNFFLLRVSNPILEP